MKNIFIVILTLIVIALFMGGCATKTQIKYILPDAPQELLVKPEKLKPIIKENTNGTSNK